MFVVAHPRHELRAYHLLERVRPVVAVLTDDSGSASTSRIGESRSVLDRIGGSPAGVFGSLTDRDGYDALISGRTHRFAALVDAIAGEVLARGVTAVAIAQYRDLAALRLRDAVLRLPVLGPTARLAARALTRAPKR